MNETINLIQNHRSIRNFQNKDIDEATLDSILHAAQSMPSSINGQHVSVIVVRDPSRKEALAELAGGQPWIASAPVFLVFVMDFYKSHLGAEKNGKKQIIHESAEGTLVGAFDGGLAMGGAIIAAESLGLGIVPIGGIRRSPDEVIELLELPEYVFPLVGLAVGHPADLSHQKPRLPFETFKHSESYQKESLASKIDQYDGTMETYLSEIGRQQEVNWSAYTSNIYQNVYFPKVYPAMLKQQFKHDK